MSNIRSTFTYPTKAHGAIPAFNSIDEEAEYWDTHDATDLTELVRAIFLLTRNRMSWCGN